MSALRRPVVVGVDGSPASFGAVRWAADEATRLGQPLRIVHVWEFPALASDTVEIERLVLDAAVEARRWEPGLQVTTATFYGSPGPVLQAQSQHASLIVVGSRGYGGLRALLVGSVGTHVAAYARCPVLVVHHAERWAGVESALPQHRPVVVGTDGSACAGEAVHLAFVEAASRNVPLSAVWAWQEPERRHHGFVHRSSDRRPALATAVAQALHRELEPWLARFPSVEVQERAVCGPPAVTLLEASQEAMMVVLGARGNGGVQDLHLGAVTQQVLHNADVPVLVARRS